MDSVAGSELANDIPTGTPGVIAGAEVVPGRFGNALRFAESDRVTVGADQLDGDWTVSVWIRRNAERLTSTLLGSGQGVVKFEQWRGSGQVGITKPRVADYRFDYASPVGEWAHLTVVRSGGETLLYADCALVDSEPNSIDLPLTTIGPLDGDVDDLKVFDTALSAGQVSGLCDPPADGDGDGVPDSYDVFPDDPSETVDTDGDGVGDNSDAFPSDPTRQNPGQVSEKSGVILTFDDHFIEEWHSIRPMLAELDVKAVSYISSYHTFNAEQRQLVQDLVSDGHEIASHSRDHARAGFACPECTTREEAAEHYLDKQVLPQLEEMAADGIYPTNFSYPGGSFDQASNNALLKHFDTLRRTASYKQTFTRDTVYVSCGERFFGGHGIDVIYDVTDEQNDMALDEAITREEHLIWYSHRINEHEAGYYVDAGRLRSLIERAQARGLKFRRLNDLCNWVSLDGPSGSQSVNALASSYPLSQVVFDDFTGDEIADGFRTTGRTWQIMRGQGDGFRSSDSAEHWETLAVSDVELPDLRFGDFDVDGITDALRSLSGQWQISFGGVSDWVSVQRSGLSLDSLRFHDFNGDGVADVFAIISGNWYVSDGATSSWRLLNSSPQGLGELGFADFDGDGTTDVLMSSNGTWSVRWGGTGAWQTHNQATESVQQLEFADVDGDGGSDAIRADGSTWAYSASASGPWTTIASSSHRLDQAGFADLDGDGSTEILIASMVAPID